MFIGVRDAAMDDLKYGMYGDAELDRTEVIAGVSNGELDSKILGLFDGL